MPFASFRTESINVKSDPLQSDICIHTRVGGAGPALLLLHGYPQTGHIWNKVADHLAERYTVVITDLRGYGKSSKPRGSESHIEYSKREMANDQVRVMQALGHPKFSILAHDRGARVAHRLAIDHPHAVERMMLLDICPTLTMYEETDDVFARAYWHWFALLKPGMEDVISAAPDAWWAVHTGGRGPLDFWSEVDIEEYKSVFRDKDSAHASCEDYRAAATIDLEHDRASLAAKERMQLSTLHVLWGKSGVIGKKWPNAVEVWKGYCEETVRVTGKEVDSGHYIPEEASKALLDEAFAFFV